MWVLLFALACGDDTAGDSGTSSDSDTTTTSDSGTSDSGTSDNTAPNCAITGPADGSFGEEDEAVTFLGTADDAEQTAATLLVAWSSDKDGELGTAPPTSAGDIVLSTDDLSVSTHVITLQITDDAGEICSAFVLYSVGQPPVGTITGPSDGLEVDQGDEVTFTGLVSDDATAAIDLNVSWSSDLDGELDTDGATSTGALSFATTALTTGHHTIELTVTDEHSLLAIDAITVNVNGVPTAPTISLSPADPDTTDDLVATVETPSVDPDGDPVEYDHAWSLFGTVSSASTDARLPADATVRGDTWTVTVTPRSPDSTGTPAEASVTIGNAVPSLTGATISPNPAVAEDTLTCTGEGFSDADGDVAASTWQWSVDGTVIGTASTQTGGFGGDDTVTCTLTPHDGTDAGSPVTAVATIGNTAPSVSVVSISPNPARVGDTLTCSWSGFDDPDGDADASLVTWSVNGTNAGSGTTLSSGFVGTDEVTCSVTPYDGASTGTPVETTLTVTNTAPSLDSATLSPNPATASDTLVCIAAGWNDADGHADQSTWSWAVNGSEVSTDTWLSSGFSAGDLVACTVTPDDGTDTGTAVSDSLTVDNTAPTVTAVAIDPSAAVAGDTLTCTWTFEDADGDSDQSTVNWTLNGETAGVGSTLSTTLARDDMVTCTVTPNDGTDTGSPSSASLTVSNSAPTVSTVTISPTNPSIDDALGCTWSGFSDPDGDSDSSSLAWTINGDSAGTSEALASGYVGGDTVTCTVTPSDGLTTGDVVSDDVTIDNTPPVLASVSISPSDPQADDTLTCVPGTTTDLDGTSSFTYTYDWSVDGTSGVGTASTLAGAFARGDTVTCTATPSDGTDDGDAVSSSAVTVVNTAPEVTDISLSPSSPDTLDTLSASVSTSDADGDSVSVSYTWYVDGSEVSGETTASLDGADHFDKDQVVAVVVVPNDGTDDGDASTSSTVTVTNTGPTAPTVQIQPSEPQEGLDDLVCVVTGESDDEDGDTISYSAVWTVDGSLWTGSTSSTTWSGDTIDATETLEGEVWECTMTPDDGDDDGDTATAEVTITSGGATCTNLISSVDDPIEISSSGSSYGAWFSDPLETLGSGYIWWMSGHYSSEITEYTSLSNFQSNSANRTFTLPHDWDGTGAIAYDGYLYYNSESSQDVVKVDLATNTVEATVTLSDAGYRNECHWTWGGWSDIDIEVDESGLWAIYGQPSSDCNIAIAQLDTDLNVLGTWETSSGDRKDYGNAWMVDGVMYVTDSYSDSSTTISFAYDTCNSVGWDPGIPFSNDHGYNSSIKYNPNDGLLYSWDGGYQVQYSLNF